jgi:glycosyltransferase involved in cell wall biosynthesis
MRGGAEFLCADQARRLAALGLDASVVTFGFDPNNWGEQLAGIDVHVVREKSWSDGILNWNRRTKLLAKGRRARMPLSKADLVVAHNAPCNLLLGALDLPSRTIWQCNEPPSNLPRELANPYLSKRANSDLASPLDAATQTWRECLMEEYRPGELEKQKLSAQLDIDLTGKLDSIYGISEFTRENVRAIYGRCNEEVVYPFVRFPEGGRRSGATAKSGLQILVQTRLELHKNVDSVVRGFAEYRKHDPEAVLHVVGDGPVLADLETLAEELALEDSCQFHGFLPIADLAKIYDRCDVFALLTLDEPFGMVYPEAAARGLLMVGPDHGGPLEILEGGGIGHCINPFEPEAFVEALQDLRGLSAVEADRRRTEADDSCRGRFGSEVIQDSLLRTLGVTPVTAS